MTSSPSTDEPWVEAIEEFRRAEAKLTKLNRAAEQLLSTTERLTEVDQEVSRATEALAELARQTGSLAAGFQPALERIAELRPLELHGAIDRLSVEHARAAKTLQDDIANLNAEHARSTKTLQDDIANLNAEHARAINALSDDLRSRLKANHTLLVIQLVTVIAVLVGTAAVLLRM